MASSFAFVASNQVASEYANWHNSKQQPDTAEMQLTHRINDTGLIALSTYIR